MVIPFIKHKTRLVTKILLLTLGLVIMSAGLVGGFLYNGENSNLTQQELNILEKSFDSFLKVVEHEVLLSGSFNPLKSKVLEEVGKEFFNQPNELFIADESGMYLLKNFRTPKEMDQKEFRNIWEDYPDIQDFLKQTSADKFFAEDTYYDENKVIVLKKFKDPSGKLFLIGATRDFTGSIERIKVIRNKTIAASIMVIILACIISIVVTRRMTINLEKIMNAASKYINGETEIDLEVTGQDEIYLLARAFQGLMYRVNERTRRIKRSEEKAQKAKDDALIAQREAETVNRENVDLIREVRAQNIELSRLTKEKDDLMAIVSHDLKNPLAVIQTCLELVAEHLSLKDREGEEILRRGRSSATFAINLITDLLDLSRLEGGIKLENSVFPLDQIFTNLKLAHNTQAIEKSISLIIPNQTGIYLRGDESRLFQVMTNIIGNALKFTPANGTIKVEHFIDEKTIKFQVSDTGRGIPQDKLDSIFKKYEQASSADRTTGTGLGLAICKKIIEMHNGSIKVESKETEGSIFTMEFPNMVADASDFIIKDIIDGGNAPLSRLSDAPLKMLLIDDSADIEALLKIMLKDYNIEFLYAPNGKEGLKLYLRHVPDVILMDLNMPDWDGLQTTKYIRVTESMRQMKPAIIYTITASNDEETNRKCKAAGCNGAINKPIKRDVLLAKLGLTKKLSQAA